MDEVQVGIVPVLLGDGLPLVEHPTKLATLKLAKHRVYPKTGTVLLDYEVLGPGPTTKTREKRTPAKGHR